MPDSSAEGYLATLQGEAYGAAEKAKREITRKQDEIVVLQHQVQFWSDRHDWLGDAILALTGGSDDGYTAEDDDA